MLGALLLLACADDPCVAMCDAAETRYEGCMEERGLSWGMSYADATDYVDGCSTWVWEERQLGQEPACPAMTTTFESGTCEDYDAAW